MSSGERASPSGIKRWAKPQRLYKSGGGFSFLPKAKIYTPNTTSHHSFFRRTSSCLLTGRHINQNDDTRPLVKDNLTYRLSKPIDLICQNRTGLLASTDYKVRIRSHNVPIFTLDADFVVLYSRWRRAWQHHQCWDASCIDTVCNQCQCIS